MKIRYFELAHKMAKRNKDRFRVGAVLTCGNSVMGMGCNDMGKSHPTMTKHSYGTRKPLVKIHAELAACRGFSVEDIDNRFALYIFRVRKNGSQGLAKPCDTCLNIIQTLGIKRIYFSLDDSGYGDLRLKT